MPQRLPSDLIKKLHSAPAPMLVTVVAALIENACDSSSATQTRMSLRVGFNFFLFVFGQKIAKRLRTPRQEGMGHSLNSYMAVSMPPRIEWQLGIGALPPQLRIAVTARLM
jgi:hypothetical protein